LGAFAGCLCGSGRTVRAGFGRSTRTRSSTGNEFLATSLLVALHRKENSKFLEMNMSRPSKKKKQSETVQPALQPAEQPVSKVGAETQTQAQTQTEKPLDRIELRLDEQGHILPMRDENRERLRRALEASSDFFGDGYKPQPAKFVDEALAARMLDAVSAGQAFVFSKSAKVPYEAASEAMRFDAEEKKTLAPPACVLMNQYGGAWLTRHGALVEFGVKFAAIEAGKIDKAMALARGQKKEGAQ
jgi:hypothetical protein